MLSPWVHECPRSQFVDTKHMPFIRTVGSTLKRTWDKPQVWWAVVYVKKIGGSGDPPSRILEEKREAHGGHVNLLWGEGSTSGRMNRSWIAVQKAFKSFDPLIARMGSWADEDFHKTCIGSAVHWRS